MSDLLPEAVLKAKKWLQKPSSDDQARYAEYEKLAAAYDGFLFDLAQGDMPRRNSVITRTLRDSPTPRAGDHFLRDTGQHDPAPTEDWKSVIGVLPSVYVPRPSRGPGLQHSRQPAREDHRGHLLRLGHAGALHGRGTLPDAVRLSDPPMRS
jgi:hypothetical protein